MAVVSVEEGDARDAGQTAKSHADKLSYTVNEALHGFFEWEVFTEPCKVSEYHCSQSHPCQDDREQPQTHLLQRSSDIKFSSHQAPGLGSVAQQQYVDQDGLTQQNASQVKLGQPAATMANPDGEPLLQVG